MLIILLEIVVNLMFVGGVFGVEIVSSIYYIIMKIILIRLVIIEKF